jgi:hypothetical protein
MSLLRLDGAKRLSEFRYSAIIGQQTTDGLKVLFDSMPGAYKSRALALSNGRLPKLGPMRMIITQQHLEQIIGRRDLGDQRKSAQAMIWNGFRLWLKWIWRYALRLAYIYGLETIIAFVLFGIAIIVVNSLIRGEFNAKKYFICFILLAALGLIYCVRPLIMEKVRNQFLWRTQKRIIARSVYNFALTACEANIWMHWSEALLTNKDSRQSESSSAPESRDHST